MNSYRRSQSKSRLSNPRILLFYAKKMGLTAGIALGLAGSIPSEQERLSLFREGIAHAATHDPTPLPSRLPTLLPPHGRLQLEKKSGRFRGEKFALEWNRTSRTCTTTLNKKTQRRTFNECSPLLSWIEQNQEKLSTLGNQGRKLSPHEPRGRLELFELPKILSQKPKLGWTVRLNLAPLCRGQNLDECEVPEALTSDELAQRLRELTLASSSK
jgi:hypothetical protein